MTGNNPLVSIVVITYNSAKYVLETLESVKAQTYQNIELIITDDCSTDNTVELCRSWLIINGKYFVHSELITTKVNTGISANCNRGYKKAKGDWIKGIAGDDILFPNCISDNVKYVSLNKETSVLVSKIKILRDASLKEFNWQPNYNVFDLAPKDFLILLLSSNVVLAPTAFISKKIFDALNGFDETIPMMEDWPFWIKICTNNHQLSFLNKETIYYRIHVESTTATPSPAFINSAKLGRKYALKEQWKINKLLWINGCFEYAQRYGPNYLSLLFKFLKTLNPMYWYLRTLYRKS